MSNMVQSLYDIRLVDEIGEKDTFIHGIHPLAKVVTTLVFLFVTISFNKYDIGNLLPLITFPIFCIILGELPIKPIFSRVLIVMPLILGLCIFNPFLDHKIIGTINGIHITGGVVSLFSVMIKCLLTVITATILIMTTGIVGIAHSLISLRVPKIFVMQLLLTYRYISVLIEEVLCVVRAYALRSPYENGINIKVWGSLTGQLLMRTFERAQRVYIAMCCRGFKGEFHNFTGRTLKGKDITFVISWCIFFAIIKFFNISMLLGLFITGGIK